MSKGERIQIRGGTLLSPLGTATHAVQKHKAIPLLVYGLIAMLFVTAVEGSVNIGRMFPPRGRTIAATSAVQSPQRSRVKVFKSLVKHYIRQIGDAAVVRPVINQPSIKRVLSSLPVSRSLYCQSEWDRVHPYDRVHGTDTSGFLDGEDILTGHPSEEHGSPYAGVQPSILRRVLPTLPDLHRCTFIDLGCGKGRPMLVASEFPFHDIMGVELSPLLCEAAEKNAAVIAKRYPERTRIRVVKDDATAFPMPSGDIVLFIYNSFDREFMQRVVKNVESAIKSEPRAIYVVYCNPASGDCFDESPMLTRRYAQTLPYSDEELGYAPDREDAVIIWQGGTAPAPATPPPDARIVILKERWRAGLTV